MQCTAPRTAQSSVPLSVSPCGLCPRPRPAPPRQRHLCPVGDPDVGALRVRRRDMLFRAGDSRARRVGKPDAHFAPRP
jgi:hypothetical protein